MSYSSGLLGILVALYPVFELENYLWRQLVFHVLVVCWFLSFNSGRAARLSLSHASWKLSVHWVPIFHRSNAIPYRVTLSFFHQMRSILIQLSFAFCRLSIQQWIHQSPDYIPFWFPPWRASGLLYYIFEVLQVKIHSLLPLFWISRFMYYCGDDYLLLIRAAWKLRAVSSLALVAYSQCATSDFGRFVRRTMWHSFLSLWLRTISMKLDRNTVSFFIKTNNVCEASPFRFWLSDCTCLHKHTTSFF